MGPKGDWKEWPGKGACPPAIKQAQTEVWRAFLCYNGFFFFLGSVGIWTQGPGLSKYSATWTTPLALFALSLFFK
jgi:hypothetical protein